MANPTNIREGMEVLGTDTGYVGKVDKVEGKSIRLAHEDPEPGGDYHFIPLDWVESVDDAVHLNRAHDEAMRQWETAPAGAGA
jgi:hypothetical protein